VSIDGSAACPDGNKRSGGWDAEKKTLVALKKDRCLSCLKKFG